MLLLSRHAAELLAIVLASGTLLLVLVLLGYFALALPDRREDRER